MYDGNLPIQERDLNNLPVVTYTRGNDLSGSLQGAGGIGGLLARTDHRLLAIGDANAHAFYQADGNGNVTALVNANQILVAKYQYDPYGNVLSLSGPLAAINTYQFSSKETHSNSGLTYYLYRFYDPNLQRWPNRDPIQERGGRNLYKFVRNNPLSFIDTRGLTIRFDPNFPAIPYWRNCICKLMSSPAGRELVRQAAQPGIDIQITSGDNIETGGTASAPIIFVNPNDPLGCGKDQRRKRSEQGELPPNNDAGCAAVLAHELGHALHPGDDSSGEDEPDGTNVHDHENPVRIDLHLPPRKTYDGCPVPQ